MYRYIHKSILGRINVIPYVLKMRIQNWVSMEWGWICQKIEGSKNIICNLWNSQTINWKDSKGKGTEGINTVTTWVINQ